MRRKTFVFLAFVIGLGIVSLSIWRTQPVFVTLAADDEVVAEEVVEGTISAIKVSDSENEYSLAYPGVLPDHPLYFLKMIRDRIQLLVTRDPLKRAELMLHYADKRIAASLVLAEKGKSGLAVSTAAKAEKYLEQVVGEVEKADSDNKDTSSFYEKLVQASNKHKKVLVGIKSRVPDEVGEAVDNSMAISEAVYEKAVGVVGEDSDEVSEIEDIEEIGEDEEVEQVEVGEDQ